MIEKESKREIKAVPTQHGEERSHASYSRELSDREQIELFKVSFKYDTNEAIQQKAQEIIARVEAKQQGWRGKAQRILGRLSRNEEESKTRSR